MTVWIVVIDAGEGDFIQGVYATLDAALAAHPGDWVFLADVGWVCGDKMIHEYPVQGAA